MDPKIKDDTGTKDRWCLCPSRNFRNKFYYFNLSSGESRWKEDSNKIPGKTITNLCSKSIPTAQNYEPCSPDHAPEEISIPIDNLNNNNVNNHALSCNQPHNPTINPIIFPANNAWAIQFPSNNSQPIILAPANQNSQTSDAAIPVKTTLITLSERFNKKFGLKRVIRCGTNKNDTKSVQTEEFEPPTKQMKSESVQTNFVVAKNTHDADTFHHFNDNHVEIEKEGYFKVIPHNIKSKESLIGVQEEKMLKKTNNEEKSQKTPDKGILKLSRNDLRYKLMKRKSVETVKTSNGVTKEPLKKKVTFKLDSKSSDGPLKPTERKKDNFVDDPPSTPIKQSETNITSDHGSDSATLETAIDAKWYIVADEEVLMEDFDFIHSVVQSDANCRLQVPYPVMRSLQATSRGESLMRPRVTRARRILRHIDESQCYIIQTETDPGIDQNKIIVDCCLQIMENGHYVVLLTNDMELVSQATEIQCYTLSEFKEHISYCNTITFDTDIRITISSGNGDIDFTKDIDASDFDPKPQENKAQNDFNQTEINSTSSYNKSDAFSMLDEQMALDKINVTKEGELRIVNLLKNNINPEEARVNLAETTNKRIKLVRKPAQTATVASEPQSNVETFKEFENQFQVIEKPVNNLKIQGETFKKSVETFKKPVETFKKKDVTFKKPESTFYKPSKIQTIEEDIISVASDASIIDLMSENSLIIGEDLENSPSLLKNTKFLQNNTFNCNVESEIKEFCTKNINLVENCEIWRDDFLGIFVQIMEELLNQDLKFKSDPSIRKMSIKEGITSFKTFYEAGTKIRFVADKIYDLVHKYWKLGKITASMPRSDFIMLIACGVILIKYMKEGDKSKTYALIAEKSLKYLLDSTPKNASPNYEIININEENNYPDFNVSMEDRQSDIITSEAITLCFCNDQTAKPPHIVRTLGRNINKVNLYSRKSLQNFNKNPPFEENHDFTTDLLLKDLALSEVSSESFAFIPIGSAKDQTLNDEGIYSGSDSPASSRGSQYSRVILAFLAELRRVLVLVSDAVHSTIRNVKSGAFNEQLRKKGHEKMKRADKYMNKLIYALKSILLKEETNAAESVTAIFKNIDTQDIRLTRYRKVIRKCLEQAEILSGAVIRSLNLTSEKPDLDLVKNMGFHSEFYNIFEN